MDNLSDRSYLLTEQVNTSSYNLDILSVEDLFDIFSEEDLIPQIAVRNAKTELVQAVNSITNVIRNKGRLFYIGAGTSGRLGVLDSAECPPTFCTPPEMVQAIIAGGLNSLIKSSENLEDSECLSIEELKLNKFSNKDCLVGISAGGTTKFVNSALKYSKQINALTISISCIPRDQVKITCNIDIRLITGPEIVTGSTRLKAGTATKMALNFISSSVMIQLGKVLGNKMIDVKATNNKLIDRSIRILCDITKLERNEAIQLLDKCKGSLKISIIMALTNFDYNTSEKLLNEYSDNVRNALDSMGIILGEI